MNSERKKKTPFHLPLMRAFRNKKKGEFVESVAFFAIDSNAFFSRKKKQKEKKGRKTYFFFLFLNIIESSLCFQVKKII